MNKSLRLLIADDEADLVEILSRRFQRLGMEVMCCGDVGECLRLFDVWDPHVALVDGHMPGNEGLWLVRKLRAGWPDVPLIMLSGSADRAFQAAAQEAGVEQFLEKPCSLAELEATLLAVTQGISQTSRSQHVGEGACRA